MGMSASADWEKGYAAFESGDYATTLREWTALAKQGYALGYHGSIPSCGYTLDL